MIYTDLTKKAMQLCYTAHKDETDRGGVPYCFHPYHIAEQMDTEETVVAALLHDVMEDSEFDSSDLINLGFPENVVDALILLTRESGTSYKEYIKAMKDNRIARTVKLADLRHNCDISRLDHIGLGDMERVTKYNKAIEVLEAAKLLDDEFPDEKV